MADLNAILRRSSMIDVSGAYQPPAIQASIQQALGGGVYTDNQVGTDSPAAVLSGRISLGILAAFVLGAVGFYLWTHQIQGGG